MSDSKKKKCCQGCKNGQPGQNASCKAKLLMEQLEKGKKIKSEVELKDTHLRGHAL